MTACGRFAFFACLTADCSVCFRETPCASGVFSLTSCLTASQSWRVASEKEVRSLFCERLHLLSDKAQFWLCHQFDSLLMRVGQGCALLVLQVCPADNVRRDPLRIHL